MSIQASCVYPKIATRLKRDGAVVRNPPTKPRLSAPTQRATKEKTYFVFNDIDPKRVEGSVCPHRRAHQLHPLLNLTLAPRQRRPNCRARIGISRSPGL